MPFSFCSRLEDGSKINKAGKFSFIIQVDKVNWPLMLLATALERINELWVACGVSYISNGGATLLRSP